MKNKGLGIATRVIIMEIVISLILLFAGIGVLVVIHACVVGRTLRRGFANNNGMAERGSLGSSSMSREDVEKLPCFDFKAKEKGSSPADCAVCLENFKAGERCRLLPVCNHSFHAECVDNWLLRMPVCPICRTSADQSLVVGDEESGIIGIEFVETGHFDGVAVDHLALDQAMENEELETDSAEGRGRQTMESGDLGVSDFGENQDTMHSIEIAIDLIEPAPAQHSHSSGTDVEATN